MALSLLASELHLAICLRSFARLRGVFFLRQMCSKATNKTCHKCNKTGHFAKCCRSKNRSLKVREIDKKACNMNESSSGEASADEGGKDYIFSVGKSVKKTPTAKVKIGTSHINMMVDSGSTVKIMSYQSIQPVPTLKSAKGEKLLPYATKKEIPIVGKF